MTNFLVAIAVCIATITVGTSAYSDDYGGYDDLGFGYAYFGTNRNNYYASNYQNYQAILDQEFEDCTEKCEEYLPATTAKPAVLSSEAAAAAELDATNTCTAADCAKEMAACMTSTAKAGGGRARRNSWTATDLTAATELGDATKCYYAIFDGDACDSNGGVYQIGTAWYTDHTGGPYADKAAPKGCGTVIENWFQRSGSHTGSRQSLIDKSDIDTRATWVADFNCNTTATVAANEGETTEAPAPVNTTVAPPTVAACASYAAASVLGTLEPVPTSVAEAVAAGGADAGPLYSCVVANCVDKVAAELAKAEAEAEAGTEAYQACYSGCGSAAMIKTSAVLFVTLIVLAAMV